MVKAVNDAGEAQSIADFVVRDPTPDRMVEIVKTTVYDDIKNLKEEVSNFIRNYYFFIRLKYLELSFYKM